MGLKIFEYNQSARIPLNIDNRENINGQVELTGLFLDRLCRQH